MRISWKDIYDENRDWKEKQELDGEEHYGR